MDNYHQAVLLREVVSGLHVVPGKLYIDATLGGGGHLVEIIRSGGIVLGIDADREAIAHVSAIIREKLPTAEPGRDFFLKLGNFRVLTEIAVSCGFTRVNGVLFDLGVSSHQLDSPQRGFSFRYPDSLLDMRLDQSQGLTAGEIVNSYSEKQLYEIFTNYGEEERARAIAGAIVRARQIKPVATTGQLLKLVSGQGRGQSGLTASAARIFQALRIVVNDELAALKTALLQADELLLPGGRLAVISFHSLEDRIVKQFFRRPVWRTIGKQPLRAGNEETELNSRSRSAKLRIGEKYDV